jgi:hypothetical protein
MDKFKFTSRGLVRVVDSDATRAVVQDIDPNDAARTVDITPSWQAVMRILIAALEDGTPKGKAAAKEELFRLAKLVDEYNTKESSR